MLAIVAASITSSHQRLLFHAKSRAALTAITTQSYYCYRRGGRTRIIMRASASVTTTTTCTTASSAAHHTMQSQSQSPAASSVYRNNASLILPVTIDNKSTSDVKSQIQQVISTVCDIDCETDDSDSQFVVTPLSGGLSNQLYVATHQDDDCYLVRIHPDSISADISNSSSSCRSLVNREQETKLLAWLAQRSLAPILHGRFENGRVEEFYHSHVPLTISEMPVYASAIASLLGTLHLQNVPESILPACQRTQGDLFDRIDIWLEMARECGKHEELVCELEQEWAWLQQALKQAFWCQDESCATTHNEFAICFGRQVVVCHMDAQSLNFLKPKSATSLASGSLSSLKMIDYEYSSRNPRIYDIANTFCEFADMNNLRADYSKDYPSNETQTLFLRTYLESLTVNDDNPLQGLNTLQQEEFIESLRQMVARATLLSHLSWSVWSVIQDSIGHITFDYLQYARHRMDGYRYNKHEFWKS
jgi:thiamine kinase-like enzyme